MEGTLTSHSVPSTSFFLHLIYSWLLVIEFLSGLPCSYLVRYLVIQQGDDHPVSNIPALRQELDSAGLDEVSQSLLIVSQDLTNEKTVLVWINQSDASIYLGLGGQVGPTHPQAAGVETVGDCGLEY